MLPRLIKDNIRTERWLMGIVWALLTAIFEFVAGLSGGNNIKELLAAYNPLTGNLWLLVMVITLFAPVMESSMRRRRLLRRERSRQVQSNL